MSNHRPLFEPITAKQENFLEFLLNSHSPIMTPSEIDELIFKYTGVLDIDALSKNEAQYVIGRLIGDNRYKGPKSAPTEDKINGDASNLPYFLKIYALRKRVTELGMNRDNFSDWLMKTTGVRSIKNLDRAKGEKAYNAIHFILAA